jgi:hypothetical protein
MGEKGILSKLAGDTIRRSTRFDTTSRMNLERAMVLIPGQLSYDRIAQDNNF